MLLANLCDGARHFVPIRHAPPLHRNRSFTIALIRLEAPSCQGVHVHPRKKQAGLGS
jgi:hypothetical protein